MPKPQTTGKAEEEIGIDFSGVRPFEPLNEDQKYLARISGLTSGQGPKGPKVSAVFTVTQPEEIDIERDDGSMETIKIDGRKLFREYSLVPQALPFLHELLRAAGEEELGADFKLKLSKYLGIEVCLSVANEEYEEQVRSRVKKVYPASVFAA